MLLVGCLPISWSFLSILSFYPQDNFIINEGNCLTG